MHRLPLFALFCTRGPGPSSHIISWETQRAKRMTKLEFSMVSLLLRAKTEAVSLPEVVGGHTFAFVLGCVHTQNAVFSLKVVYGTILLRVHTRQLDASRLTSAFVCFSSCHGNPRIYNMDLSSPTPKTPNILRSTLNQRYRPSQTLPS